MSANPEFIDFDAVDVPVEPEATDNVVQGSPEWFKEPEITSKLILPTYYGAMDMSNEEYHAAPGISSSSLKFLDESALHFEQKALFTCSKPCFEFGTLVHTMILELDDVSNRYAIAPKVDLRTNAGKDELAKFTKESVGKTVITSEDYETAKLMTRNVMQMAGNLLQGGISEKSYFADDRGLLIKCRPDYYREKLGLVIDVKTIDDISEHSIKKHMTNFYYDFASVFYPKVLTNLNLYANDFVFLFIEKKAPYMVKFRRVDFDTQIRAIKKVEYLLDEYRRFKETGIADVIKNVTPYQREKRDE